MTSFLEKVQEYISKQFALLSETYVIVPSRRSVRVLKQIFVEKGLEPPLMSAIDDFILNHSALAKTDSIELLLLLQKIAHELLLDKEKQDNMLSWLPTLLRDFNAIDQNLVNAKQLFSNLADIERIKKWNLEDFRASQTEKNLKYYFDFWDNLYTLYQTFRQKLQEQNKSYAGMAYRHLAENTETILVENKPHHYVFAGFNAFNKAEEIMIVRLKAKSRATVLWDTDDFYMESINPNPAGKYLKKYKKDWGEKNWLWQENHLLSKIRAIKVIESGSFSLQASIASQLLSGWSSNKKTAIVLPDESLLLPLLHAIDETKHHYNVTMGLNLQNFTLFSLLTSIFEMQQSKKMKIIVAKNEHEKEKKYPQYYYKDVFRIFNHPFIRKYEQILVGTLGLEHHSFVKDAVKYIISRNKIYLTGKELRELPQVLIEATEETSLKAEKAIFYAHIEEPMRLLFATWGETKVGAIARKIQKLLVFFEQAFEQNSTDLEVFYIKKFKNIFKKLRTLLKAQDYELDLRTFKNFLFQIVRDERIPFEGKQESNLQIMGFLETRALDFEQVIILSANEGTFPQGKKTQSLIPFDVACEFGLPHHEHHESLQSYHFYRLLQRTEQVAMVYCSSKTQAGNGNNEVSRYVLQLEHDLIAKKSNTTLTKMSAKFALPEEQIQEEFIIPKNAESIQAIRERLQTSISPSALDMYVKCSMRFYFTYIAGIKEADEVEEEVEAGTFGTIIHAILEDIFADTDENGTVSAQKIETCLGNVEALVKAKFKEKVNYSQDIMVGSNMIAQIAAVRYLSTFLEQQIAELKQEEELSETSFEILSLENKNDFLKIQAAEFLYQSNQEQFVVRLRGTVDRVDKIGGVLRIIDYKTGNVKKEELKLNEEMLCNLSTDPALGKARQLWLYKYLLHKNIENNPQWQKYTGMHITAGIYSLRNIEENLLVLDEKIQEKPAFLKMTENWLQELIGHMLDSDTAFAKTTEIQDCLYCDYKNICSRS